MGLIDEAVRAETWVFYGRDDTMGEKIRKTREKINDGESSTIVTLVA